MRELVTLFGSDDLPLNSEVNPYVLGTTASVVGNVHDHGRSDPYVARTANRVDSRLGTALSGSEMVLVVGPPKVGKTRTLFEAVRNYGRSARVLVPTQNHLRELANHPRLTDTTDPLVVWLDDLHEYVNAPDPLTPGVLAQLTARPGRTVVVATLRSEKLDHLRGERELRRDIRLLFEQALIIGLMSTGEDPDEQIAAKGRYPSMHFDNYGLGELLGGGPKLTERQRDSLSFNTSQRPREDPNWAYRQSAAGHADLIYRLGIEITTNRMVIGTDHLIDAESCFRGAAAVGHMDAMYRLVDMLGDRGEIAEAETWLRQAADAGHSKAMYHLGVSLADRSEIAEGESWLHKAAEVGDRDSMYSVGIQFAKHGQAAEAESWLRKAAAAGHPDAKFELARKMYDLGISLAERGETAKAESLFSTADDAYPPPVVDPSPFASPFPFGISGDVFSTLAPSYYGAATRLDRHIWYRCDAMYRLGVVLANRGEIEKAESWLRTAADSGHHGAKYHLRTVKFDHGVLLTERGELAEAESWLRKAAADGHNDARYRLGVLLTERGKLAEAESWLRKATGNYYPYPHSRHPDASYRVGVLLAERGETLQAKTWFRRAAEAGHQDAASRLDALFVDRRQRRRMWPFGGRS